ncbi:hypothetical protein FACS18947_0730 [Bacteroidia bacterium]|nr:hypothetical protein FACS18947_0730 [Bacteroidia bacterium]
MRIQLTTGECRWLADLACKEKIEAALANKETPHPLLELRHDNMADLENKLNSAIQKERRDAR